MSASLVGSEMCIRDSPNATCFRAPDGEALLCAAARALRSDERCPQPLWDCPHWRGDEHELPDPFCP
eukprot:3131066-Alexandrium_andersonii.AAC.1